MKQKRPEDMQKVKELVLMLLKETRYYYGEFNFKLFNSDIKQLRLLMSKAGINLNLLPVNKARTIDDVRNYVSGLETIKRLLSW
jgi:hypothetical protein